MYSRKNNCRALALIAIAGAILVTSCAYVRRRQEAVRIKEVRVDCYPGPANVYVVGVPEASTVTPGVLRLRRPEVKGILWPRLPRGVLELRFVVDGRPLKSVFVRWLYSELGMLGWYKTYIGSGFKMSSVDRFTPDDILVIDKDAAVARGEAAPIVRALQSRVDWVRRDAAEALGEMGQAQAVEPLMGALRDVDTNVRVAAAKSLGRLGDQRAIEALAASLRDPEPEVCVEAAMALERLGDMRGSSAIMARAEAADVETRARFVEACGRTTWDGGRDVVLQALTDRASILQETALRCLLKTGRDVEIEPVLECAVGSGDDLDMKILASECLWALGQDAAISSLVGVLRADDVVRRERAAFALGHLGFLAEAAVTTLIDLVEQGSRFQLKARRRYQLDWGKEVNVAAPSRGFDMTQAAIQAWQSPEGMAQIIREKWQLGRSPTEEELGLMVVLDLAKYVLFDAPKEEQKRREIEASLCRQAEAICLEEVALQLSGGGGPVRRTAGYVEGPAGNVRLQTDALSPDSMMTRLPKTCVVRQCAARVQNDVFAVVVELEMNPVAYALERITGQNYGESRESWRNWFQGLR